MSCETASFDHFFVVRWGDSTESDINRVIREVRALADARQRPIYYLGILPPDMPKINEQQRDHFMRLSETLLPLCSVFAVAVEATGFRGAIQRSAMVAITLLTRKYRGLRFVDSPAAALDAAPGDLPAFAGVAGALRTVGAEVPERLRASA